MPGSDEPQPTTDFELDRFQLDAIAAIDRGESVLVAAPTGSGKTVVAEHAVARALATGGKAFYTTPIKALSNQKYHDLVARHGADAVGLLTGDNAINGDAPVVVMTTEVLRNMIYAARRRSTACAAWCSTRSTTCRTPTAGRCGRRSSSTRPPDVRLVCLSATVSNAEELADWIAHRAGADHAPCVETERPVELRNLYLVGDRGRATRACCPPWSTGDPTPRATASTRTTRPVPGPGAAAPAVVHAPAARGGRPARATESCCRPSTSSSAGPRCDDAGAGLPRRRAPPHRAATERRQIRDIAEAHVAALTDADLDVLGYDRFMRRARSRHRRPPRRHGAAVQGGGRGVLRRRAW